MNITEITQLAGADRKRKRIGRGEASGHGKTAGRGHKGGGSRSGWKSRGQQQGGQMPIFRRVPKRGFSNAQFTVRYAVVNVSDLEAKFDPNAHVTSQALLASGLIRDEHSPVKVLGSGDLKKKLKVDAAKFSKTAEEKIKAAGGEARVV